MEEKASQKAFKRLEELAHKPPNVWYDSGPNIGYGSWIAELQCALARYERRLEEEEHDEIAT
jgi:hypothetical protein